MPSAPSPLFPETRERAADQVLTPHLKERIDAIVLVLPQDHEPMKSREVLAKASDVVGYMLTKNHFSAVARMQYFRDRVEQIETKGYWRLRWSKDGGAR